MRPPSWARSGCESANEPPELGLHDLLRVERGGLGGRDGVAEALDVALAGDLLEAPGRPGAQRRAAGVGADAVDRGLHDDLEHGVAVEALGERLADAADRLAQARALELELLEPSSRARRAIVLNSVPSAANSSLPSVGTSTAKSPPAMRRAASSRRWICACSERETVIANAKAAISAAARIAMTSSEEALRPPFSRSASRRTLTRPPSKPGPSKPVTRSARPPISTSP